MAYSKTEGTDKLIMVVNLDPANYQQGEVHLDMDALGLSPDSHFQVHDLLSGNIWNWSAQDYVSLSPEQPAHILHIVG